MNIKWASDAVSLNKGKNYTCFALENKVSKRPKNRSENLHLFDMPKTQYPPHFAVFPKAGEMLRSGEKHAENGRSVSRREASHFSAAFSCAVGQA